MDKKKINKILQDDKQFDSLLGQVVNEVHRDNERKAIEQMKSMTEDEFRQMLAQLPDVSDDSADAAPAAVLPPVRRWMPSMTAVRAFAACMVGIIVMVGVFRMPMSNTSEGMYASMFKAYYQEYTVKPFDAHGDQLNAHGQPSTAQLIQMSSEWLEKGSMRSTNSAIATLEKLLNNDYRKKSLDPEIHWYLALGYLKTSQRDKAIEQLNIVKDTGKAHAFEAKDLLDKLNNTQHLG